MLRTILFYTDDHRTYNVSADEYYEDAIREAFEILGDHQETILTIKQKLNGTCEEKDENVDKLRTLLQPIENLITKNIEILKEKFGSELSLSK